MVLSSLSFVFFHGVPPVPFIVAFFVVAMIWAAIYHKTSVLWVTIYHSRGFGTQPCCWFHSEAATSDVRAAV